MPFSCAAEKQQNIAYLKCGMEIFNMLKKAFPNDTVKDSNAILYTLCASLVCHLKTCVDNKDHGKALELVRSIIKSNL